MKVLDVILHLSWKVALLPGTCIALVVADGVSIRHVIPVGTSVLVGLLADCAVVTALDHSDLACLRNDLFFEPGQIWNILLYHFSMVQL